MSECEFCLADEGEPCADDCVGRAEVWAEVDEWPEPATRSMDESLAVLAAEVHRLPYGNLVGLRGLGAPDRQDYSPQEYIDRLAVWMAEYGPILRAEVDALQAQSVELISLRMERDMVRHYLTGVPV